METIKCVTVGDEGVGKSSLLNIYVVGNTPREFVPPPLNKLKKTVNLNERLIRFVFWDIAGHENYDRLRKYTYPNTEVILLCFSIVNPSSFRNIELQWIKEIRNNCFSAKIILIGTKLDLRNDQETIEMLEDKNEKPISPSEGMALAEKIKAFEYVECSALTGEGLSKVFEAAAESVLSASEALSSIEKRKQCSFM